MASTAHSHRQLHQDFLYSPGAHRSSKSAFVYLGLPKMLLVRLLVILAVWKAALVAMHFMHLKFEKKTLSIVAIIPFVLCVFLILMLLPDIFPR